MEGHGLLLLRVIRELRSDVRELERENSALRSELSRAGEEGRACPAPNALRRNVSAGSSLELQQQEGNAMTVRRYSVSSCVQSGAGNTHHKQGKRNSSHGSFAVQGREKQPIPPTVAEIIKEEESVSNCPADYFSNKITKVRSFQDCMYKCRGTVKTVNFLLPKDTAYSENQFPFQNVPNQNSNQLSTILEKDSWPW